MSNITRISIYQFTYLAGLTLLLVVFVLISNLSIVGSQNCSFKWQKSRVAADPLDATYYFEGNPVTLINGLAQESVAGASVLITRVWSEPAMGDLNADSRNDYAFIITQEAGGSGSFFYIAAALGYGNGYIGTNAVLLGDRIAPQNISVSQGQILVNYAERLPDEPMTAKPSVGRSAYLSVSGSRLLLTGPKLNDKIQVTEPLPNALVSSPLMVSGQARGTWYFEASFPVSLLEANGNNIATDPPYIMTDKEWMTTDFVPFEAILTFTPPATKTGWLILKKDNPSGLPANDDSISIPIRFAE
ncbi:MAG TPA: hypothetical protein DEA87_04185 [Candidatus Veblenbacteria bacterium]|uniref:Bacterial spore germination immunoglobulin-like domain-containing protein n=2 Tax=Candidatus Vebleniibacteriota TaxID=1817921 RepID=A0A1G2Q656_9BACT|nr:MAG: hypothetical protein UV69_C0001G0008 [Parcubacteria group bacterium GW2011_GWE2_43_12]KKT14036.1 MAG: hypothetical protein UV92_C0008G0027 [Parcubacteria group bacterium GW2011_GWA1_43_27]KKT15994.1 MAG: hypothetical protein UV96_C0007G0010 [Parcubacteria group bacterium GW2011_GWF2_43_38]KKT17522.1 MAG: hypothetical protein UW00_C0007G0011 [Parcubacteria group bacterium GW2011_GWB1_43_66]KKT27983.1 MAG: hypothetical protein UW12_C0011G0011 [Parcubacteria group bacterium GW2011_GWF1_43_